MIKFSDKSKEQDSKPAAVAQQPPAASAEVNGAPLPDAKVEAAAPAKEEPKK